jgi:hypothetical protein
MEYVSSNYNDAFGFFITGPGPNCGGAAYNNTNVAALPNNTTTVTIDNVNANNNSAYYVAGASGLRSHGADRGLAPKASPNRHAPTIIDVGSGICGWVPAKINYSLTTFRTYS